MSHAQDAPRDRAFTKGATGSNEGGIKVAYRLDADKGIKEWPNSSNWPADQASGCGRVESVYGAMGCFSFPDN